MNLTNDDRRLIFQLRYRERRPTVEVARIVGCSPSNVRRIAPGWPSKVDNSKLRAAFEASGRSPSEIAQWMGWRSSHDSADGTRVKRALGIVEEVSHGRRYTRRLIDLKVAARLADAIGVSFDDIYDELEPPALALDDHRCECGELMVRPADRCGFCEEELRMGERVAA